MEHLNKQQVILIALLVAIVTSITTGIVTVTLSDKTAEGVPQTIYKVVEKTIEKVTPVDSPVRKIVDKDTPKPTSELSLTEIVEKAGSSLLSIWRKDENTKVLSFVSFGAIVGSKNTILAFDGSTISDAGMYVVRLSEGKELSVSKRSASLPGSLTPLVISSDTKDIPKISSLNISNVFSSKLGTNVIAIGSKEDGNVVSTGIVTELASSIINSTTGTSTPKDIMITDLKFSKPSAGWLLLSTKGELIGLNISGEEGDKGARYIDAGKLKSIAKDLF